MQFTKIASAAALLALSASAFAATPAAQIAISSGASASKGNLKVALASLCTTAGGTMAEYASGSNISTYVCASGSFSATPTAAEYAASTPVNFSGTNFAEVRLNVSGGSFTAACLLAFGTSSWSGAPNCASVNAGGAADSYQDPATLTNVLAPAGSVVVGGLMDVEPTGFVPSVRSGIATPATIDAGFAQAFGVAVSDALYTKMFDDQKLSGKLHSSCLVTDTAIPACVPVIGKAQMAAIMNNSLSNEAAAKGAQFLAPSQFAAATAMTYARRVNTSGTQAVAQEYFLGNVCSPAASYTVANGGSVKNRITVQNLSGTGNVRTTLNTAGLYAIGVMSLENNQTGQSWKWLRVGGMHGADNAAPGTSGVTNTVTAKDGTYDMVYNSRVAVPATTGDAATFWGKVKTAMTTAGFASTIGLYGAAESKFTRGTSNSCLPFGQ